MSQIGNSKPLIWHNRSVPWTKKWWLQHCGCLGVLSLLGYVMTCQFCPQQNPMIRSVSSIIHLVAMRPSNLIPVLAILASVPLLDPKDASDFESWLCFSVSFSFHIVFCFYVWHRLSCVKSKVPLRWKSALGRASLVAACGDVVSRARRSTLLDSNKQDW